MRLSPAFLAAGPPVLGPAAIGTAGQVLALATGATQTEWVTPSGGGGTVIDSINDFRLSTESGVPVSTTDRTAQSTLHLVPLSGGGSGQITVPSRTAAANVTLVQSGQSLGLGSLTADAIYDLWAYQHTDNALYFDIAGSSAWTNSTTRSLGLTGAGRFAVNASSFTGLLRGHSVATGKARLVGTIRATGTTTTEDSALKRFVGNVDNSVLTTLQVTESADSWVYNGGWRQTRASSANQVELVLPVPRRMVGNAVHVVFIGATNAWTGIGINSTTSPSSGLRSSGYISSGTGDFPLAARTVTTLAAGYSYIAWLERSAASVTFSGDNSSGTDGSNGRQSGLQVEVML